jgi:DNA-binding XRE family transcriptional regulator
MEKFKAANAEPDIRQMREERGLSQEAAAKLIGINRSQYQRAEEGKAPPEVIAQVVSGLSGAQVRHGRAVGV